MDRTMSRRGFHRGSRHPAPGRSRARGRGWRVHFDQRESGDAGLRRAIFEVRHELKVVVPEGAQRVRVWFVLPQEGPMPGDGTAAA
jgi:hypothetical protein